MSHFVFFRVEPNDIGNIIRVVVPDIAMFIVSLVVFILCRKFIPRQTPNDDDPNLSHAESFSSVRTRIIQTTVLVNLLGQFLVVLLLAASGIAFPSVISSIYFLTFLGVATWWSCYKSLGRKFAVFRILLLIYSGANLVILYLYQFQFFQEALAAEDFYARYFPSLLCEVIFSTLVGHQGRVPSPRDHFFSFSCNCKEKLVK